MKTQMLKMRKSFVKIMKKRKKKKSVELMIVSTKMRKTILKTQRRIMLTKRKMLMIKQLRRKNYRSKGSM